MSACFPECVRVIFDEYAPHVSYAANLAEQLHVALLVHAPVGPRTVAAAGKLLAYSPQKLDDEMLLSVREAVRKDFRYPEQANIMVSLSQVSVDVHPENGVLVSCDTESYRGLHVLSPAGEQHVFRTNKGPILVPLGDGESGLFAAACGIALAQQLETNVLFWHTTWQKDGEQSSEPRKHVCTEAERIITQAEAMGRNAGVTREGCRIECSPTVIEGIIRVALRSGSSLIVMSRGRRKKFGAYADRVRARNCPVPLLILAREPS